MKFFYQLSVVYCLFGVVASKMLLMKDQNKDQRTLNALIFKHCEKDDKTIIVSDDSNGINTSWAQQLHEQFYSVILFQQKLIVPQVRSHVKKIDAILITTRSSIKLIRILKSLCKTVWWNVMIPVYILNLPNENCKIAMKVLKHAWENKILTSYFLCVENNEVQIYTYNPFANRTPDNWIRVKNSMEEPQWTLYRRKYEKGIKCQELNFDRTRYLDGHQMTVAYPIATKEGQPFIGQFVNYSDLSADAEIISKRIQIIIDALTMELNVTLRLYFFEHIRSYKKNVDLVERQKKHIYQNSSANLIFIQQALQLSNKSLSRTNPFQRTYPLAWSEYRIATYNRGYQTFAEKLWEFYGIWTILFTIIVLLITFVVIWFTESKRTSFAIFEIIRLLINHSLYTRMNTLPLRIFFITILIYVLIGQATFHGHLAKFLTKPELRRHPETEEDLKELGYTKVYDSKYVRKYLAVTRAERTLGSYQTKVCLKHILHNDSSVACVFDREMLLIYSKRNKNLYVSKQSLQTRYKVFSIHKRWPLANRVNLIFMLMEEFGFRQLKLDDILEHNRDHTVATTDDSSDDDFHPIKMENLIFSFSILAIGLITATLSFFVEIYKCRQTQFDMISRVNIIEQAFVINKRLFFEEI